MWCASIYFKMWIWILISLNIISKLHAYSGGNLIEACDSMLPNHNGAAPQNTEPPFMVEYVPGSYPGEPVTVLLKSEESTYFRGFMLEAREVADETRLTGKFVLLEPDRTQLLTCGGLEGSAVSHTLNLRKTLIRVNWTATEAEQDITFRATFLQTFGTFWENVNIILPQQTSTFLQSYGTFWENVNIILSQHTTTIPNTTKFSANIERAGIALMCFDSVLMVEMKGICNIGKVLLASEAVFHHINKVSKVAVNVLCVALEISSLILFSIGDSFKVIFFALVCVTIVINSTEIVVVSLGIRSGPEGKKICEYTANVCFVIHKIFTIAVIFLGVMENDCGNNVGDSWLLKVMIAFTVWDFLNVIWIVILCSEKRGHLGMSERNKQQRKKKSLRDAVVNTVSVILFAGAISFSTAIIVGIFTCQKQ
ncbi:alpha-N-acetylgalactosaminide alpha-2,6-sialyltransferase (sialyltransferase 7B) [Sarotherodon galilaeus]